MASNSIGEIFRLTTFGESHGPVIGAVIDGCPAGLSISQEEINEELSKRTQFLRENPELAKISRIEDDRCKILSGVFKGQTLGTPIAIIIENKIARSEDYNEIKNIYRPGHGDFTYDAKYGIRDYRGGGRASGRETVARIAGGFIGKKLLHRMAGIEFETTVENPLSSDEILALKKAGDSRGGIVRCCIRNLPPGLGEPVFDKLDAVLAKAVFSIGGVKGLEFGSGFDSAQKLGSENNDFIENNADNHSDVFSGVKFSGNNAGGVLGGISTGQDIVLRVAIKPTPSISLPQRTVDSNGNNTVLSIHGRHDAYLPPKIMPIIEAMCAISIADLYLRNKTSKID